MSVFQAVHNLGVPISLLLGDGTIAASSLGASAKQAPLRRVLDMSVRVCACCCFHRNRKFVTCIVTCIVIEGAVILVFHPAAGAASAAAAAAVLYVRW